MSDAVVLNESTVPANTANAGKLYVNSTSKNLVYLYNNVEYPIGGQTGTVESQYRFQSNLSNTFYSDAFIDLLWDSTRQQPQFRLKILPYGPNKNVDGGILYARGANVQTYTGVLSNQLNALRYFSGYNGAINTNFNFGPNGMMAECWLVEDNGGNVFQYYPTYAIKFFYGNGKIVATVKVIEVN